MLISIQDHINNDTVSGKLIITGLVLVGAFVVGSLVGRMASHRVDDHYRRFYVRKGAHYGIGVVTAIGIGIVWRPFAGQLGLMVGLITAGIAFALQQVIGSLAGGMSIISGSVFRVGDRIDIGGVSGDVIDITPLRTRIMEIGSSVGDRSWVHGRQYTGRIVSIANIAAFGDPVYNYSAGFDFTWEEITLPIAYWDDWKQAEQIMTEEAVRISAAESAGVALQAMVQRYPIARTDIEDRVFVRATDNYLQLAARFVVPLRQARVYNDLYTRRVLERFAQAGISVASQTSDVTVRTAPGSAVAPGAVDSL